MRAEPVVNIKDLYKSFNRGPEVVQVLQGVNMDVINGEGVAIVGASGTGKSTLLHLLGGLERPDKGTILYNNEDICCMNDSEIALFRNRQLGFVFQFHFLLPEFSALENVMMPALVSSVKSQDMSEKALHLLEIVGLKDRVAHKPGELSGGEQQRVAIARALMMSPKVLLADEPTGDLDPGTGQKIIDLFSDLKDTIGVTMVIATHNMELAGTMDRIMNLTGGQLESFTS
ncbi:MAG TPA: ABC transporter ATP-binding protein [Deltaproteobacteria bacterium]|nr:ABC transporter ATP-binding protein [Deltaproteobacteria bacterium]